MNHYVDISFRCIPLRSVGRFDLPVDAVDQQPSLLQGLHQAVMKHGAHNAYYLCEARCVFHLTNDDTVGTVSFRFEGTLLTDPEDQRTIASDLAVELDYEVCDWLTNEGTEWLQHTVDWAVRIEFDRYIAAGDLQRTIERHQRLAAESEAKGGYLGMGL